MTATILTWECVSCGRPETSTTKMLADGLCTTCRTPAAPARRGVGAGWGIPSSEHSIALTAAVVRASGTQLHTIGWRPVTDPDSAPYPGVPPTHIRIEWFAVLATPAGPGFTITETSRRLPHALRVHNLLAEVLRTLGVATATTTMGAPAASGAQAS